jgi:antirestriction protein ArdC
VLSRGAGRFHRYSWGNQLLIAQQRPTASHVCGFKTWPSFGRHVRKGEKGIKILAPIVGKKKADDDQPENERREAQIYGFKVTHVFDLAQTDGEDLPATPGVRGNADTLIASLEIVQKTACQILDALTPANRPE